MTSFHRNDRNPAGISGASIRAHGLPGSPTLSDFLCLSSDFPEVSQAVDQFESSDEDQELQEDDYYTGSDSMSMDSSDSMSMDGPECTGMLVKWKPGSIWDSYPYQQHGVGKLPWEPIGFENDDWLRLHSRKCSLYLKPSELQSDTCQICQNIPNTRDFKQFMDHGSDSVSHTSWKYLNYKQIHELLAKATAEN